MKKVLSIVAVALTVALVFTSCKKEKTMTELLTIEKGWVMSAATTTPYWTLNDNSQITNLFEGYVYDCEKDDIIKFKEEGNKEYVNAGEKKYDYEGEGDQYVGEWAFNEKETVLECQLPLFSAAAGDPDNQAYSAAKEQCNIISLEEDKMVLSHTFDASGTTSKAGFTGGPWTFQFTYVPAKK